MRDACLPVFLHSGPIAAAIFSYRNTNRGMVRTARHPTVHAKHVRCSCMPQ